MKMSFDKQYKCVNCGEPATALYKTYGPSVVKLTKCDQCHGIVDKYIEYDPVIVMIDLVLVSKEAQRHVLYNTEFKGYWKLFIILLMIETYALWKNNSLFNIAVNTMCGLQTNSSTLNTTELSMFIPLELRVPESFANQCWGWRPETHEDSISLWEEDFYVIFMSTFIGVVAFIATVYVAMKLVQPFVRQNEASLLSLLKAFSLANVSALLWLPTAVWGADEAAAASRAAHHSLVAVYSVAVFLNALTVVYDCPLLVTALILLSSNCCKFLATFHAAPIFRGMLQSSLFLHDLESMKGF